MNIRTGFEQTLLEIAKTRELLSLAFISILFYAFYYPAPYSQQEVVGMPLVLVDATHSSLGRDITRSLGASRAVTVVAEAPDLHSAEVMMRERRAEAILLLSRDLDGLFVNPTAWRSGAGAALILNAAYFARAEAIALTLSDIIVDAAARRGATFDRALFDPDRLIRVQPLFNTTAGYRDYIFPAISNIILQQTLLFASARMAAERRRRGFRPTGASFFWGSWLALLVIGVMAQMFFFGYAYWLQDIPRAGNVPGLVIAMPLFAGAVAALGLLIGGVLRNGDDALKLLVPTSVPLVFLAGFAWPLEQMPRWLATLAWISPATPAMHLFVRFNQMGATIAEAFWPMLILAIACVFFLTLNMLLLRARMLQNGAEGASEQGATGEDQAGS